MNREGEVVNEVLAAWEKHERYDIKQVLSKFVCYQLDAIFFREFWNFALTDDSEEANDPHDMI